MTRAVGDDGSNFDDDDDDLAHLRRCVTLAAEAVNAGDEPFGSLLVDAAGQVRFEDRNRISGGDATRLHEQSVLRSRRTTWRTT